MQAKARLTGLRELALLGSIATVLIGAGGGGEPSSGKLSEWARGPVRWLLRPVERRQMRRVRTPASAATFVERFWARRDPDRESPGNRFRELFYQRVEEADLLYSEKGLRGSMADRGRALILLGPPSSLRIASRPTLRWNPERKARTKVTTRLLPMEIWGYERSDLSRVLGQSLAGLGETERITLSFVVESDSTYLVDGEEFLELAARVVVAKPH